jgi:hypothetical protein
VWGTSWDFLECRNSFFVFLTLDSSNSSYTGMYVLALGFLINFLIFKEKLQALCIYMLGIYTEFEFV